MRASILSIIAILTASLAIPAYSAMQEDVDQAVTIIEHFQEILEKQFRRHLCVTQKAWQSSPSPKADSSSAAEAGPALWLLETEKGWSGPSAIGTGGIGFGFQAGVQISELVIVLTLQRLLRRSRKEATSPSWEI